MASEVSKKLLVSK